MTKDEIEAKLVELFGEVTKPRRKIKLWTGKPGAVNFMREVAKQTGGNPPTQEEINRMPEGTYEIGDNGVHYCGNFEE